MSTETDWYVYRDQQRWGPYAWQQMLEMAQNGHIMPKDRLWHPQYPNFINANQVQGLFESSKRTDLAVSPAHQMGRVVCPKCEKDDQIQKVTSIFTGGVSTSVHTLHNGLYSGTSSSQTALSKRLSPPAKPKSHSEGLSEMWSLTGCFAYFLWAFFIGIGAAIIIPAPADFGVIVSIGFIGSFISILLLIFATTKSGKDVSDWETMITTKYYELYYCYRDDCVFDPRTNKYISPEGMRRLLE